MKVAFEKYHGTGNDFIIISAHLYSTIKWNVNTVRSLCDRHFGIGADGLILVDKTDTFFKMRYFNADGYEGTMCGNGGRCFVAYLYRRGSIESEISFDAIDGIHDAKILESDGNSYLVKLKMKDVEKIAQQGKNGYLLDTGSPHLVVFVNDLNRMDVEKEGKELRNSLPGGVNVNFCEIIENLLNVRTYERGVEAETLSCGTGVTASALASVLFAGNDSKNPVKIITRGGSLSLDFKNICSRNSFEDIWLTGPAAFVYNGVIEI